jgi:hypothetical protein
MNGETIRAVDQRAAAAGAEFADAVAAADPGVMLRHGNPLGLPRTVDGRRQHE